MKILSSVGVLLLLSISSAFADTEFTVEFVNKGNKPIHFYHSDLTCIDTNRYNNMVPPNSSLLTFWRISDQKCPLDRSTASLRRDDGISFLRLEFSKKRMDLVGLLPYGFIEVRKHEQHGVVTFLKTGAGMGGVSEAPKTGSPTTLRDKLVAVGTFPLVVQGDGQVQEPESFNELLKELQYETAHLKIQMAPPSQDVAANVREEAMALVEWMDANPSQAASLQQHTPGRLTPDLDKALAPTQNTNLQQQNAVSNQQQLNQLPSGINGKPVVIPSSAP